MKTWVLRIFRRQETRPYRKNLCCEYMGRSEYASFPLSGVIHVNFNYCPVCGRDLRMERKRPCDMRPRKG